MLEITVHKHSVHYILQCRNTVYTTHYIEEIPVKLNCTVQKHSVHYTLQCRHVVHTIQHNVQTQCTLTVQKHRLHYTVYTTRSETQCKLQSTLLTHSAHYTLQSSVFLHTTLHNEVCYCTTLGRAQGLQCQVLECSPVVVPESMVPSMPGDCSPLSHLHCVYILWLL